MNTTDKRLFVMQSAERGLNQFETAVLEHMARNRPWLRSILGNLRVVSRELTGSGSYTEFEYGPASGDVPDGHISLDKLISMPGIENGMGAVLFLKEGRATVLETFVYGEGYWDGTFSGFSIAENA